MPEAGQQSGAAVRPHATLARPDARSVCALRGPKPEQLRVLLLGATSDGGLRVGREQERIRGAVQSATHRSLVELDVHPAATTDILLDALTRFRPHVVHFSATARAS